MHTIPHLMASECWPKTRNQDYYRKYGPNRNWANVKCKLLPFFVRFSCEKAWNLIQMKLVITECTAKRAFTNEFIWTSFRVFNKCHSFLLNSTTQYAHCTLAVLIECTSVGRAWKGFQFVKIKQKIKCADFFFSFMSMNEWVYLKLITKTLLTHLLPSVNFHVSIYTWIF